MGDAPAPLRRALVVDLDGTLLHPEPGAIAVPGRRQLRYMSGRAAELLAETGRRLPVVIATGRHARSVWNLIEQLPEVDFGGFVTENGFVARAEMRSAPEALMDGEVAAFVEALPEWQPLLGYERTLGFLAPKTLDDPETALREALAASGRPGYVFSEGHKLFIYPQAFSKRAGLELLGVEPFVVMGNDLNDLDLMDVGRHPVTLADAAEEVRALVAERGGYCSPHTSHAGTEDMLGWVLRTV